MVLRRSGGKQVSMPRSTSDDKGDVAETRSAIRRPFRFAITIVQGRYKDELVPVLVICHVPTEIPVLHVFMCLSKSLFENFESQALLLGAWLMLLVDPFF